MKYAEIQHDLFTVDPDYHLAHCISSDIAVDKGIAVLFNQKFNLKARLLNISPKDLEHPTCVKIEGTRVFNLITKELYYHIPTYNSVRQSLLKMRKQIEDEQITKLAMPKIASGLDRKKWEKIRDIIHNVFKDTDIEILICYL
ncbi:MAG: hypothetical protein JW776_07480 [Candidatus Lokiarchaeota archaeon]|nr:hypothetical protein [Candidatus Lokiarchaeota archaeon]